MGGNSKRPTKLNIEERTIVTELWLLLLVCEWIMLGRACFLCYNQPTRLGLSVPIPSQYQPRNTMKKEKIKRTSNSQYSQTYPAHHPYSQTTVQDVPHSHQAPFSS
jgi:hypothetical protein